MTTISNSASCRAPLIGIVLVAVLNCVLPAHAQSSKKKIHPASKIYFSEVRGAAEIHTGDKIEGLEQRSVFPAQGSAIETKKAEGEAEGARANSTTMVYSNGTGAYFHPDTRVEIRRFVQEPFVPSQSDADIEPSISQTQAFISRGMVGLCASRLVAGSSMSYQTPHASVNIRGRRVVIEATSEATKISMLEGESTIRAGSMDMGGHTLKAGEQAIIRPGEPGQGNSIEVIPIPAAEFPLLDERVALACAAKKMVYFDVQERRIESDNSGVDPDASEPAGITAFDGDSAGASSNFAPGTDREIVPVPLVPVNLPVQFTVSPATLPTPAANLPGG
jgi:hypothetical protein